MLFTLKAYSQDYQHATFWGRLMLTKEWKSNWFASAEYIKRTQNNFEHSSAAMFDHQFVEAQRLTIGYKYKKWGFSLAPSHWQAYQLLGKESDFLKVPTHELRLTPTVEYTHRVANKWVFNSRTQQEFRFFETKQLGRFRQRIQVRYLLNKTDFIALGNEILWGSPPNSSNQLEQNQVGLLFQKRLFSHLDIEIGYRFIYRKRGTSPENDSENALIFSIFYRL